MPEYPHKEELIYDKVAGTATNTAREVSASVIDLATHLALSRKKQVRVEVTGSERLAEHDLLDAKEMLKEGMDPEDIKIEISKSPVAQDCDRPDLYVDCIVSTADRQNTLGDDVSAENTIERNQDLQL